MDDDPLSLSAGLLAEGTAMLRCLVTGAVAANYEVHTAVRSTGVEFASELKQLGCTVCTIDSDSSEATLEQWIVLAKHCDLAVVIAPESGGLLSEITSAFTAAGIKVAGCSGDFLKNASDKWLTAVCLAGWRNGQQQGLGMLHPQTWLLSDFPVEQRVASEHWVIKPRDGVGCEGLQIVESAKLPREIESLTSNQNSTDYIIQPRVEGLAASCSALVDCTGRAHWLPLSTQRLVGQTQLRYQGGTYNPGDRQWQRPDGLLQATIESLGPGALGWIGVDLIYNPRLKSWTVIEVNPRCTSSVIGAVICSPINLIQAWVEGSQRPIHFNGSWGTTEFSVEGDAVSS